jgi:hypothetical protein
MPFRSQAQRAFMFSQHPGLAREFEAATPKGSKLPARVGLGSQSNESPALNRTRVRRVAARDFLQPKAGLERGAMKQGPVSYQPSSRGRELGAPSKPGGLQGRDVRVAAAALVRKGR